MTEVLKPFQKLAVVYYHAYEVFKPDHSLLLVF